MSRSTPHAPLGAEASFDFGPAGEPAAFRLAGSAPRPVDVFVGCRATVQEAWSLLPFFTARSAGPQPLPKGRFGRFMALAGDKWMIGPLVFKLCTPFPRDLESTDDKFRHAPVVCGYLEYDNSHSSETAELVVGLGARGEPVNAADVIGFSFDRAFGFATHPSPEAHAARGAEVFGSDIGPLAALRFTVPPQSKRIFPLAIGFYAPGYHYGRAFAGLADVLAFGLAEHARYLALADALDAGFMRSTRPFEAKTRATHEVRERLVHSRRLDGEPEIDLAPLHALAAL